jgi:hypothetical protein
MNDRLADLRLASLDEARDTMREIALVTKRLAVSNARHEKKVADLAASHEADTEGRRLALDRLREDLGVFVERNKQLFQDPRTVKTEFGEFGLRTVSDLVLLNDEQALQHVMERGYVDCFETIHKLVKPALRKRLEAEEPIPGAMVRSGDTVVCKVSKTLIEDAVKNLED